MVHVIEESELELKIQIVQRQTNYTKEETREKLVLNDFDEMKCIRDYLGIPSKKTTTTKTKPASLNQQIYKEIRNKLGSVELPKQP